MTQLARKSIILRRVIAPGRKLLGAAMAIMGGANVLLVLMIVLPGNVFAYLALPAFALVAGIILLLFVQLVKVQVDDLGITHIMRPFLPYWSLYGQEKKYRYTWSKLQAFKLKKKQQYSGSFGYLRLEMMDGRHIEIQQGDDIEEFTEFSETIIHLIEKHAKHVTQYGSHQSGGKVKALYNYQQAYIPSRMEGQNRKTNMYQALWMRVMVLALAGFVLAMLIIILVFYLEDTQTGFTMAGHVQGPTTLVPGFVYLLILSIN